MYRNITRILILFSFIFTINQVIFCDIRQEKVELFLVVDKSKSMIEEIDDVAGYIVETFVDDFLIAGDRLVLIEFFGKADIIYDQILSEGSRSEISDIIRSMEANGRFTDIGNALDRLDRRISETPGDGSRRYLILLTDGMQEAPPESLYYSADGSFNHSFLEHTKTIRRKGWKIEILGIGRDSAVRELSDELSTTYRELNFGDDEAVSEDGTSQPPDAAELLGRVQSEFLGSDGGSLSISLSSEGYAGARTIVIRQIMLESEGGNYPLLSESRNIIIEPSETLPVTFDFNAEMLAEIPEGTAGIFVFDFEGDTPFLPAVFETAETVGTLTERSIEKNSGESSQSFSEKIRLWHIIIIVILAAAGITAAVLIRNSILHGENDDDEKKRKISDDN